MTTRIPLALALLAACTPTEEPSDTAADGTSTTMSGSTGDAPPLLELGDPCEFGRDDAAELALVTNDFVDPAGLARVDVGERMIFADLLPATTDTALAAHGDLLLMIHRYMFNRIDVVDRAGDWKLLGSVDVAVSGVAEPNPQAAAFAGEQAFVPLFGAPEVQVFDFSREPGQWKVGSVDLSGLADADGNPEAGLALACGATVFVALQRLDPNYAPVDGHSWLAAIDAPSRALIDLDPDAAGPQAIALLGTWPKQFRRDPADLMGHTALVLTSGVERVDLSYGTSEWAIAPETFDAAGIAGANLQAFALAPDGASAYVAASDAAFASVAVYHVGLDGGAPQTPTVLVDGLGVGDRMLEQLGGLLWVGDATADAPRLRVWDLAAAPPKELEDGDLRTDTPPWTFLPLP